NSPLTVMRGSAVRWSRCWRNSTPGRVVTAAAEPASSASGATPATRDLASPPVRARLRARLSCAAAHTAAPPGDAWPSSPYGDHAGAHGHLAARVLVGPLLEHDVVDRVRRDGDERIGGKRGQLVPVQAQVAAERRHVDAIAAAQIPHDVAQRLLGRQTAQPPVEGVEHLVL